MKTPYSPINRIVWPQEAPPNGHDEGAGLRSPWRPNWMWHLSAVKCVVTSILLASVMLGVQGPSAAFAEGTTTTTTTTDSGSGQSTLALSKTPGVIVDADKLLLVPQELFSTTVGDYSVVRLTKPARLVIDFPNVSLNRVHRNRKYDVKRHGIETVAISEEKGPLYPTVRITMVIKQPEALAQFRIAKDGPLIAVMPPVVAPSLPSLPSASPMPSGGPPSSPTTMAGVTTPPRSSFVTAVPMAQPSPSMASVAMPSASAAVRKPGTIAVEDIRVSDNGLLLMGRDVGTSLRLANRFQLNNPSRVVFDFANAQLASKQLAQTLSSSPKGSWRSIRIGQFDERTVRVAIETNQPKAFNLVRRGDPAVGQGVAIESANALYNSVNTQTQPTSLANVMLSKEADNGQGQLRIQSKDPMAFQIYGEGSQVVVDLLNVPLNGPAMGFNVSSFDYIRGLTQRNLFPKAPGSSLVLELKGQSGGITHELLDGGRTLILSFDIPKSAVGVTQPTGPNKPWQPPASYDPQNPPAASGSLAKAPFRARVVVDAGHGGKDQGASRSGVLEKDLNLSQALKLRDALEARGMTVLMTRSEDSFVPLPDISGFSNRNNPDLFISVHHNTSSNPSIYGLETYYYQPQSIALANRIHKHMVRLIGCNDRGVRKARFYVVNHTTAPSVLIEIGYLSNPTELANVQSDSRQKTAAEAIANGVVEYLNSRLSASAASLSSSTAAGQPLVSPSANAPAVPAPLLPAPLPTGGTPTATPSNLDPQRPPTP
jgi:N-acetylmuramoyl-L-alanine amidase